MPILLKLYRCFCHDLKICMWFGYYPEIIFCHFFCNLNLVIFKCTIMAGDINSLNLLVSLYLTVRGVSNKHCLLTFFIGTGFKERTLKLEVFKFG